MGALLGDEHLEAGPGDLVHKPRGQWHTFWDASDEPCRILGDPDSVPGLVERFGLRFPAIRYEAEVHLEDAEGPEGSPRTVRLR